MGLRRLLGLDALRGIAALAVLGFHLHTVFGGFDLFRRSYLAVDLFFMLSGFVMARTYEGRMRGELPAITFLSIRFRRLFAPVAVGTLIGFAFFFAAEPNPLLGAALVAGIAFVPLYAAEPFILNRPTWSIFFELVANAAHVLLFKRCSAPVLAALAFAAGFILVAYTLGQGSLLVGYKASNFLGGFPRVIMSYLIGILLFRAGPSVPSVPGWLLGSGLLASLLLLPIGLPFDVLFVLIICPALILAGTNSTASKASAIVGSLSFPLYAVHYPILQIAKAVDLGPMVGAACALACAIAVGLFVDRRLGDRVERTPVPPVVV